MIWLIDGLTKSEPIFKGIYNVFQEQLALIYQKTVFRGLILMFTMQTVSDVTCVVHNVKTSMFWEMNHKRAYSQ